ncbi:unnamed protein product [Coffea canephora]|uniref:Uncharacterized protein n=1 Tax=Coffea canephora TaxID=49390 RepID=A0A068UH89_COFCA|nr:unnamed protein product [Coffea canephora]
MDTTLSCSLSGFLSSSFYANKSGSCKPHCFQSKDYVSCAFALDLVLSSQSEPYNYSQVEE